MRASGVALLALVFACGGKKSSAPPGDGSGSASIIAIDPKDQPEGLVLRLSHGKQGAPAFDRAKLAPATKLPEAEVTALLAKAPPITTDPTDAQPFALRPASAPPPVTGETIKTAFPPPPGSDTPPPASLAGKPLTVTRFRPDGETPEAPSLSVTFSHPMVAMTSQTAAAQTVPVKLVPTPKGTWRWIGTRTIVFDAEPRFPHATTYRVEVPAGTKSATGEALAKPVTFSFETPAPRIVQQYPPERSNERTNHRTNQRTDTPILIVFDQKVDPAAMLGALRVNAFVRVKPEGEDPWSKTAVPIKMRLVDAKEIAAHQDERFTAMVGALDAAQAGRWIVIRAAQALPLDSKVVVELPAGAPSLEGPNKTKTAESFWFPTYSALAISSTNCESELCPAGTPLRIQFTNELDSDVFDPKLVTIKPPIPDAEITGYGDSIHIQGTTVAQTKYSVTIAKGLKDRSGQTLGKDATRTIPIGDARELFLGPNGLVVLDPALAAPSIDVHTTNHPELKVKLYRVGPADFPAYEAFYRERWRRRGDPGTAAKPPGKLVSDLIVKTTVGANQFVATKIDLAAALGGARGHVLAVIEPHPWDLVKHRRREAPRAISWVQVTKLAVDAHVDGEALVGFTSDLATGAAIGNVELELRPAGKKITTDAQGIATLPLPPGKEVDAFVVARRGEDVTIISGGDWRKKAGDSELVWYTSDDRAMYRPGETVSVKGWLRSRSHGKGGDLALPAIQRLTYIATDAQDVKLATGAVPVDALGGFDLKLALPKTPNLGHANIEFFAPGSELGYDRTHHHEFQIQEFRRPEFEVTAVASPGPFTVGDSADITVNAKYYAGGPLPGAFTKWTVFASETTFTPPNQPGYSFGSFGFYDRFRSITSPPRPGPTAKPGKLEAQTDGSGAHTVHVDFVAVKPQVPMSVVAMAEVEDVNRQQWSAHTTVIVHPASLYVGVKPLKPFVTKGTPIDVEMIGVDLDGKPVAGAKLDVQAVRLEWEYKRGEYAEKEVDPQACKAVTATVPAPCKFQTPVGGRYLVTATITDNKGRKNQSQSLVWVSGGEPRRARSIEQETIEIVPDKAEYAPGTTAEVLVATPFYPAEGIVTWQRNGIIKTERIT
ncbi:MAG TPA: Ig-like domain-containing protein, partial [Kofleriaceae bacterium]